ncbi:AAA family ATPase [Gordonia sp. PDNC005]|uniref:RNA polymerase recycling motor ATPase HelR n=1 Tax=unclassified Gordonia (in: high G+C Gram-positive bacteria) TaxID=2657482 RepID=UPI001964B2C5|nr:RNA polymerase recycling motor ATPase HelR [Gordonia sp. PDNC005]QRY64313.1 AAA family ATPase [Gordonia sp. PDNC005]
MTSTVFRLSAAAKGAPGLIEADIAHLSRVAARIVEQTTRTKDELSAARRLTDLRGGAGVERDLEIRRLETRLRTLSRLGADVVLGRIDPRDGEPVYIGRIGLSDADGTTLLVDWRTPDAAPFFAATLADPRGLSNRRHYRWASGSIVDYWDERFTGDDTASAALDAQSAFIASLGASRSSTMQSVLGTIAADQDAAIRASSRGVLLVDGGPGTGKTVVALHRAAYLLYSDPRLQGGRGRLLIVGPHRPYLAYISDVLPSLGEEGVTACTLAETVDGGERYPADADPRVTALKSKTAMVEAIEPAVAFYEEPPRDGTDIDTDYGDFWMSPADWAEAIAAVPPGTLHNEARGDLWAAVLDILVDTISDNADAGVVRAELSRNADLHRAIGRVWPLIEPEDLVSDLWSVPAYLRRCAPELSGDEIGLLQRDDPKAWTAEDVPLLDAAARRLGDSGAARRAAAARTESAERRRVMDSVVDDLIDAADDAGSLVTMLRAEDIAGVIVDDSDLYRAEPDALAGPFAHIVVDEAQELSDAQWQMLIARCPSGSMTIVGDRAQARDGFTESWEERFRRVGLTRAALGEITTRTLTVNYRTPAEIMAVAGPEITAALHDARVPTAVRASGEPVRFGVATDLDTIVTAWLADNDGTVCVIGATAPVSDPRVRTLTPVTAKGLEFDLVVLVQPEQFGTEIAGAVDRYVAMTRSTRELVILR